MGEDSGEMNTRGTDEIEQEIRETESDITETVDELKRRLSPRNLARQAKEKVCDATGRALASMSRTVKEKPWLPLAVVSGVAGAAWYFLRKRRAAA